MFHVHLLSAHRIPAAMAMAAVTQVHHKGSSMTERPVAMLAPEVEAAVGVGIEVKKEGRSVVVPVLTAGTVPVLVGLEVVVLTLLLLTETMAG